MVTSPLDHCVLHTRGLVPNDWVYGASSVAIDPSRSQLLLVSLIPTHLQARRCSIICNTIFQSHYGHESRLSESASACIATRPGWVWWLEYSRGACPFFFFASGPLLISFRLQLMATLKEGDQCQMWEFRPLPSWSKNLNPQTYFIPTMDQA